MSTISDPSLLRQIAMLADLQPWQLEVVAGSVESVHAKQGEVILECGSDDGYTYFLTEGELSLDAADGLQKTVAVGPETIRHPVANLRPRIFAVTALSAVRGIRVPDIVLSAAGCDGQAHDPDAIQVESQEEDERRQLESKVSFQLYRDLKNDRAVLPTLPDLAMRIRRAIDDELSDARAVARLVEADPAMAAKLLKVANSALYAGLGAVESCSAAVVRLGMQTTKQLVTSFALKDVFHSRDPAIQQRMHVLWKHSAQIAAICFVLARETDGIPAEEALLAGLVHDVGVIAILNYVEQYPELAADQGALEHTVARMRSDLGAMILREWNFTPAVIAAARDAENWVRTQRGAADLTDLLIVAQVHEMLRKHQLASLPPLHEISAMQRLLGEGATPERTLEVLHEAKAQVDEMRSMLRG
jgi:HD-like signal output (HDOD) protein